MADPRELMHTAVPPADELDMAAIHARAQIMRKGQRARARGLFAGTSIAMVILVAAVIMQLAPDDLETDIAMGGQSATPVSLAAIGGPSVTDPQGGTLSLADYPDTPLLVYVWAPWCGPCPDVLPDLQTVATELDDVAVVTVAIQTDREAVARVISETGVALPTILLENAQALAPLLQLSNGEPVPLVTFTPAEQGSPLPTPSPTAVAEAPGLAPLGDVLDGLLSSPLATAPSAVPLTVALDADHRVAGSYYGTPDLDRLRDLGALVSSDSEFSPAPTSTPLATSLATDPVPAPAPTPGVIGTPSLAEGEPLCIPIDPPLIGVEGGTYEVQEGDTLSEIAETVFGDPLAFAVIADANSLGERSTNQEVGEVLIIPSYPGTALCEPIGNAIQAAAPSGLAVVDVVDSDDVDPGAAHGFASTDLVFDQIDGQYRIYVDLAREEAPEGPAAAWAGEPGATTLADGTPAVINVAGTNLAQLVLRIQGWRISMVALPRIVGPPSPGEVPGKPDEGQLRIWADGILAEM